MAITKIQSESLNLADDFAFTGTITGAGGVNTPMFQAKITSNITMTNGAYTKISASSEDFDIGSYYDNSTNYRYTPLVAGKYFVYCSTRVHAGNDLLEQWGAKIEKNGSTIKENYSKGVGAMERGHTLISTIIDMDGVDDYLEFYAWGQRTSGTLTLVGDGNNKSSGFGAYKIIE